MSERNHVNGWSYAWGAAAQIDLISQQPNAPQLWTAFFQHLEDRRLLDELAGRAVAYLNDRPQPPGPEAA